jgi:antitoxin component of RelBE/YafQ-DinJ toxin-antitoxin module
MKKAIKKRQYLGITDSRGFFVPNRTVKFLLELVAKKKGIPVDKIQQNEKELLPLVLQITKNPTEYKKIKDFIERKVVSVMMFKSEVLRSIKYWNEAIYIEIGGKLYKTFNKPKASKMVVDFEKKIRERFPDIAVLKFNVAYEGDKKMFIRLTKK